MSVRSIMGDAFVVSILIDINSWIMLISPHGKHSYQGQKRGLSYPHLNVRLFARHLKLL